MVSMRTPKCCRGCDRFCDGVGNVVQFQIEKHLRARSCDRTHDFRASGGVKLQADLEK